MVGTITGVLNDRLGGPVRRRAILLFAAVLALDSADKGTVGAVAPAVKAAFHVGNTGIGLLAAVGSLVGCCRHSPSRDAG